MFYVRYIQNMSDVWSQVLLSQKSMYRSFLSQVNWGQIKKKLNIDRIKLFSILAGESSSIEMSSVKPSSNISARTNDKIPTEQVFFYYSQ